MPRRRLALTAQGKCNEYCSLNQYSFRGLESGETDWSVSGRFVSGDGFTPADWHASNPIHKGSPENSCLYGKPKLSLMKSGYGGLNGSKARGQPEAGSLFGNYGELWLLEVPFLFWDHFEWEGEKLPLFHLA